MYIFLGSDYHFKFSLATTNLGMSSIIKVMIFRFIALGPDIGGSGLKLKKKILTSWTLSNRRGTFMNP